MTSSSAPTETIASEPVIVEVPSAEKPVDEAGDKKVADEKTVEEKKTVDQEKIERTPVKSEKVEYEQVIGAYEERRSDRQPVRVIHREYSRSRSRSQRRGPGVVVKMVNDTTSLNNVLAETDACVETLKGQLIYITSHPFHTADLQKYEWLFHMGASESWIQKPTPNLMQFDLPRGGPGRPIYYEDGYEPPFNNGFRQGPVPIARLGAALRIFKDDTDPSTSQVKFVTVVQIKSDSSWVKLLVSHSRQAAAADVCHELLNGHSILFMGAVLKDVALPAENQYDKTRKLVRVENVKEAEGVEEGVVGVIC